MAPVQTPPPAYSAPPLTLDEFLARHGGDRVDVIDGVVQELRMPKISHALAMNRMGRFLDEYAEVQRPGLVCAGDVFVLIRKDPSGSAVRTSRTGAARSTPAAFRLPA